MFRSFGARVLHFARRRWRWLVAVAALPVVLLVAADVLLDEPLRRQLERRMNERLHGYTVTVGGADFHVLGLSIDLENLLVLPKPFQLADVAAVVGRALRRATASARPGA